MLQASVLTCLNTSLLHSLPHRPDKYTRQWLLTHAHLQLLPRVLVGVPLHQPLQAQRHLHSADDEALLARVCATFVHMTVWNEPCLNACVQLCRSTSSRQHEPSLATRPMQRMLLVGLQQAALPSMVATMPTFVRQAFRLLLLHVTG